MFGKNKKGRVPSAKKDFTKLKTPHTYAIIFFVVIACWLLTFLIPAGKFSTHEIEYTDANGETATRTVLMADTFRYSYNLDWTQILWQMRWLISVKIRSSWKSWKWIRMLLRL